jgi:hypothetical protein
MADMQITDASSTRASRLSQPVSGQLFKYGDDAMRQMSVFVTGSKTRAFVVVNGQTEGLLSLLFLSTLSEQLLGADWSTIQVQLASSCVGYGGRTHVGDAEDLNDLVEILTEDFNINEIALYANGNGVQVALEFMSRGSNVDFVTRLILQGGIAEPTGDCFTAAGATKRKAAVTELMANNRGEELVDSAVYDLPTTAARLSSGGFPSLQEAFWGPALAGNKDHLVKVLRTVRVPLCLMLSCSSNYKPGKDVERYFSEMLAACASTPETDVTFFHDTCDEMRVMLKGSEAIYTTTIIFFLQEQDRRRTANEEAAASNAAEELRRSRSILAKSSFK